MLLIPVITSDRECFVHIVALLQQNGEKLRNSSACRNPAKLKSFCALKCRSWRSSTLPTPGIDSARLLGAIRGDSWLLSTGLIGLCDSPVKLRESGIVKGVNTVAFDKGRISRQFPQVINIICNNRHMLFHRVIGNDFGAEISSELRAAQRPSRSRRIHQPELQLSFQYELHRWRFA